MSYLMCHMSFIDDLYLDVWKMRYDIWDMTYDQ